MKQYDVGVIGGGPAGYIAAIKAAGLGGQVVLFEKDVLGGTCLNRGCIPAKTYLKGAEMIHHIQTACQYGIINNTDILLDMKKAVAHKNDVVGKLTGGVRSLLKSYGVEVIYGEAQISSKTSIICNDLEYHTKNIILSGGSKVGMIPVPGIKHENVLTSDEIFDLEKLPKHLAIIGGGVIGCELATAFRYYGCEITVIEAEERILPQMDKDISGALLENFEEQGIQILTAHMVKSIAHSSSESTILCENKATIKADRILLSIGRIADLSCLGALKGEFMLKQGKLLVDDCMRTNIPNIYAAGDINGRNMLAHAAFKMGETAAKNAMNIKSSYRYNNCVPSCIYTLPEAAGVGMTEDAAKEKMGETNISIGKFPFAANGRALASNESAGFVKVIIDNHYKEILGVHIFGGLATEMISEAAALISSEIPADEVAEIMHAHPTYSEAFMEACADALHECMHLPKKK